MSINRLSFVDNCRMWLLVGNQARIIHGLPTDGDQLTRLGSQYEAIGSSQAVKVHHLEQEAFAA